ncbi:hypothetical protein K1719_033874 [Acacia pycnantha]|nr:hypothetical protein K1719_033874 [Acacia pycnantha]
MLELFGRPPKLHSITAPWPFYKWGMDILGPFKTAPGQLRWLIVAVDYFTKWIEAEPLTTISSARVQRFVEVNIITRFGAPAEIVTDNGTQFTGVGFRDLIYEYGYGITLLPWNTRSNGQVKPPIKSSLMV